MKLYYTFSTLLTKIILYYIILFIKSNSTMYKYLWCLLASAQRNLTRNHYIIYIIFYNHMAVYIRKLKTNNNKFFLKIIHTVIGTFYHFLNKNKTKSKKNGMQPI